LHLQNDAFLPQTINPTLAGDPSLALPTHSLNGLVQTWLRCVSLPPRAFQPETLPAKDRFYDFRDQSRSIPFGGVAVNDSGIDPPRHAGRWSYQKHNADLDARWRLGEPVALTTGVG